MGKMVFNQFNFDLLVEQVIECIDKHFQTFGSESVPEIDYEVISQILEQAILNRIVQKYYCTDEILSKKCSNVYIT